MVEAHFLWAQTAGTQREKSSVLVEMSELLSKVLSCLCEFKVSWFRTKKDSVLENKTNLSLPYEIYEKRQDCYSPGF